MQVGITGGIGSGKSIVSRILMHKGFPVFNSDDQAKWLIHNSKEIQNNIIALLGEQAFVDGQYNRPFVAEKIFSQDELRVQLNNIIHPAVRNAFKSFAEQQASPLVFNEAAILFETGAYLQFDETILICAPMDVRLKRVTKRDGTSEKEIKSRMEKQWSDEQKMKLTNWVVHNDDQQSVLLQLEGILSRLI